MSDHIERACRVCGSLLHHYTDCQNVKDLLNAAGVPQPIPTRVNYALAALFDPQKPHSPLRPDPPAEDVPYRVGENRVDVTDPHLRIMGRPDPPAPPTLESYMPIEAELLPCPFCGAPAVLTNVRQSNHTFIVGCYNELCVRPRTDGYGAKEDVIGLWNHRPVDPSAPQEEDEDTREARELGERVAKIIEEEFDKVDPSALSVEQQKEDLSRSDQSGNIERLTHAAESETVSSEASWLAGFERGYVADHTAPKP